MSTQKGKSKATNRVNLRITDKGILDLLEELYASPAFKNKTACLNEVLYHGVVEVYQRTLGKKVSQEEKPTAEGENTLKLLRSMRITQDQSVVSLHILERLMTIWYNLEMAKAEGIAVTPELLQSETLDHLPEHLEEEFRGMMKTEMHRRKKK